MSIIGIQESIELKAFVQKSSVQWLILIHPKLFLLYLASPVAFHQSQVGCTSSFYLALSLAIDLLWLSKIEISATRWIYSRWIWFGHESSNCKLLSISLSISFSLQCKIMVAGYKRKPKLNVQSWTGAKIWLSKSLEAAQIMLTFESWSWSSLWPHTLQTNSSVTSTLLSVWLTLTSPITRTCADTIVVTCALQFDFPHTSCSFDFIV